MAVSTPRTRTRQKRLSSLEQDKDLIPVAEESETPRKSSLRNSSQASNQPADNQSEKKVQKSRRYSKKAEESPPVRVAWFRWITIWLGTLWTLGVYLFWVPAWIFLYCGWFMWAVHAGRMWQLISSHSKHRPIAALMLMTSFAFFVMSFHATFRLPLFDDYSDVEMTRVGHVSDSTARIWIRYPVWTNLSAHTLSLYYRKQDDSDSGEWIQGPRVDLHRKNDWTGTVELDQLDSDTNYQYTWIQHGSDSVKLIPFSLNGRRQDHRKTEERFMFKTLVPRGEPSVFTLLFGSCLKPNFPYGSSLPGFSNMAKQTADLILLLGDFIYVDLSIYFGSSLHNYRRLYREVLGQPDSVALLSKTPMVAMFDDHEILNNWDRGDSYPYENALQVFNEYLGKSNPTRKNGTYFSFFHGDVAIFVTDTRSFRRSTSLKSGESLPFNHPGRTMLGSEQLNELFNWLSRTKDSYAFKLIATSVPFTFNWQNDDTWFGYQHERQLILDFIFKSKIPNVVFLSGDRHQVAAVEFEYEQVGKPAIPPVVEFSVGPISQFWLPFPTFHEIENQLPVKDELKNETRKLFPASSWIKDKTLYYSYWPGFTFGKLKINTKSSTPSLAFCLYSMDPFEKFTSLFTSSTPTDETEDYSACEDESTTSKADKPVYQYVLRGKSLKSGATSYFSSDGKSVGGDESEDSWSSFFTSFFG